MALFELDETSGLSAKIKVIGVGGGGGNAVNNMIRQNLTGVEFIVANTDAQVLDQSLADIRLQLGSDQTRGLGAGGKSQVGRISAESEKEHLRELLVDTDMLFITAGMGGGTGTGAAPVIAEVAREMGILSVGVVTKPFAFEGKRRMRQAEQGLEELRKFIDTLIVIPNQKLVASLSKNTSLMDSFREADNVLYQAVKGISDLMSKSGYINVDFEDVKAVMSEEQSVATMMGTGRASGENRACDAVEQAISSTLLEDVDMQGARAILINVTGNDDLGVHEVHEAVSMISELADEDANVIFGFVNDPDMGDELSITVVATGLNDKHEPVAKVSVPAADVAPKIEAVPEPTVEAAEKPVDDLMKKTTQIPRAKEYAKQLEAAKIKSTRVTPKSNTAVAYDEEQLSIPTWIRRQSD